MFLIDPIGKTLAELHDECGENRDGYSVFVLRERNDFIGEQLDKDISIGLILQKHPEYADHVVVYENMHYGTWVLRVAKGQNIRFSPIREKHEEGEEMKARLPSDVRRLSEEMRVKVRVHIKTEVHLVLVEVFGWGAEGERMQKLDKFAQKFLEKYDTIYGDDHHSEHLAIINRLRAAGIDHNYQKGSGLKVEYSNEHDIAFLPYVLGLRKLFGFGEDRIKRFGDGVNKKTEYYNRVFAGEGSASALSVMQNRLSQYGRKKKQ